MLEIIRNHYKQFRKFSTVGLVNTVIDFGVFFVFNDVFGVGFIIAHILAFFAALGNSFFLNAIWTFQSLKRDQLRRQMTVFALVGFVGLVLSTITIYAVQFYAHLYIAKLCAMFVSMLWNYIGSYLFVFKKK